MSVSKQVPQQGSLQNPQNNRKYVGDGYTREYKRRMVEEIKVAASQIACSKECQLVEKQEGDPALLSKWKKSAARFQPSCKSHLPAEFSAKKNRNTWKQFEDLHDREVLDAAEALTYLSRASTNRF